MQAARIAVTNICIRIYCSGVALYRRITCKVLHVSENYHKAMQKKKEFFFFCKALKIFVCSTRMFTAFHLPHYAFHSPNLLKHNIYAVQQDIINVF